MSYTNYKDAVDKIIAREAFKGNTLWAYRNDDEYLVFSYATPIAVFNFDTKVWTLNDTKYSVTTSKHQTIVRRALDVTR